MAVNLKATNVLAAGIGVHPNTRCSVCAKSALKIVMSRDFLTTSFLQDAPPSCGRRWWRLIPRPPAP